MQTRPSSDWSNIFLTFVFLGATGAAINMAPRSSRDVGQFVGSATGELQAQADRGFSSQAWQDPFAVLPQPLEVSGSGWHDTSVRKSGEVFEQILGSATKNKHTEFSHSPNRLDVWLMLTEAGQAPEKVEDRRRHRVAVHEALQLRGYSPIEADRIHSGYHGWNSRNPIFLSDPNERLFHSKDQTGNKIPVDPIPFVVESFARTSSFSEGGSSSLLHTVVVCWVDESEIQGATFRFLDSLSTEVDKACRRVPSARVIFSTNQNASGTNFLFGPTSSGNLKALLREPAGIRVRSDAQILSQLLPFWIPNEIFANRNSNEPEREEWLSQWLTLDRQEDDSVSGTLASFEPLYQLLAALLPSRRSTEQLLASLLIKRILSVEDWTQFFANEDQSEFQARIERVQGAVWRLGQALAEVHQFDLAAKRMKLDMSEAPYAIQHLQSLALQRLKQQVTEVEHNFPAVSYRAQSTENDQSTLLTWLLDPEFRDALFEEKPFQRDQYIYSPRATASRSSFFKHLEIAEPAFGPDAKPAAEDFAQSKEWWLSAKGLPRNSLQHITVEDREIIGLLIDELNNRGVELNEILLILEWGSYYADSFKEAFQSGTDSETLKPMSSFFFRGIDGIGEQQDPPADVDPALADFPVGRAQTDYLTRVAKELEEQKRRGKRIRAVGVVCRDVYDKLMILQAIHPVLDNAILFTTDADARLAHSSQLAWTKNLLVASGHGLSMPVAELLSGESTELGESLGQLMQTIKPPPFRDSYQTSTFLAAFQAVDSTPSLTSPYQTAIVHKNPKRGNEVTGGSKSKGEEKIDRTHSGFLFEVSSSGLVDLTRQQSPSLSVADHAVRLLLAVVAICTLLQSLGFDVVKKALRKLKLIESLDVPETHKVNAQKSVRLIPLGVSILIFGLLALDFVARLYQGTYFGEPYSFTNGTSSWPRLMWLFAACVLSGTLLFWMLIRQREYAQEEYDRHVDILPEGGLTSKSEDGMKDSLTRLKDWADTTKGLRVFRYSCVIAVVYTGFFLLFAPTFDYHQFFRDPSIGWLSTIIQVLSNLLFVWMCSYYAITLARYLARIDVFFDEGSEFPEEVLLGARDRPEFRSASMSAVDQLLDVEMVGRSSAVVGNMLLLPSLSLAAVMLGLSSYFDAANFSASWVVFHAIPIAALFVGATLLRATAERVRMQAISAVGEEIRSQESEGAQKANQAILQRIQEASEGAFAPWHHRPVFKAVLYPLASGGIALFSSGMRLWG